MVDSTIPFSSNPKTLKRQSHVSWQFQNAIGAGRRTTSPDTGKFAMLKRAEDYLARTGKLSSEQKRTMAEGESGPDTAKNPKTIKSVNK